MGLCPSASAFRSSSSTGASSSASQSPAARFSVVNVDEYGNDGSKGILEVYSVGLLLRRRHTADVFWPLKSLRRYGCNEDLFTFESGRQCETGPGVFAFRLKRPDKLFSLVKTVIESEAQALIEGTRRQQQGIGPNDVNVVFPGDNRFASSSSPSNPTSLITLSRMPNTNQMSGSGNNLDQTVTPSQPFPNHHEFIDGTPLSTYTKTSNEDKINQPTRGSRPPPLNLTAQLYTNAAIAPQQKTQVPQRWDYVDLAEPTPANSRSPQSTFSGGSMPAKPISVSIRSSGTDSSTHYTQVDISRTAALHNASTAAPSSVAPSSHSSGSAFTMPTVSNVSTKATSSTTSLSANGNHPALPVVSKSAKGSD